jgi:hypothetical protein
MSSQYDRKENKAIYQAQYRLRHKDYVRSLEAEVTLLRGQLNTKDSILSKQQEKLSELQELQAKLRTYQMITLDQHTKLQSQTTEINRLKEIVVETVLGSTFVVDESLKWSLSVSCLYSSKESFALLAT